MPNLAKPEREIDAVYIAFVKSKPCCLRGIVTHLCQGPSQPHHVSPRNGTKGIGSKVGDRRCVPVCFYGHREAERQPNMLRHHFSTIINELNQEYNASRTQKPQRQPRKKRVGLKSLKVNCECGHEHDVPAGKVTQYGPRLRYRCIRTNEWQSVNLK